MMISEITREKLKNDYKNCNGRNIKITAEPITYPLNDKDGLMPMIKILYAVYQQVKNC